MTSFSFSGTQSQIKLKVEVNGFSLDQCSNIYRQFSINLSDEHLCAGGEEGKGSCNGDSGDLIEFQIKIRSNNVI